MASPQPDRFVRVSTELLEAVITTKFTATQLKIVLWVIRKTYGWNRKTTLFSWYSMARELQLSRSNVHEEGRRLINAGVLCFIKGEIGIQKDYEKWFSTDRETATNASADVRCDGRKSSAGADAIVRCNGRNSPPERTPPSAVTDAIVRCGGRNSPLDRTLFREPKDSSIDISKDKRCKSFCSEQSFVCSEPPPTTPKISSDKERSEKNHPGLVPRLKAVLDECPHLRLVNCDQSSDFWDHVLGALEEAKLGGSWLLPKIRQWNQWFETHLRRKSKTKKHLENRLMRWLIKDLERMALRK